MNPKQILVLIWVLVNAICPLQAQDFIPLNSTLPSLNHTLNRFTAPGDSLDMLGFFKKFDQLTASGKGKMNVVQIGGSHVQADMWTGRVRQHFNTFLNQKEVERGFMFPYKAVKTNGSIQFDVFYNSVWNGLRNVKLNEPEEMGAMGWSAQATDSGQYIHIKFKEDDYASYVFDHLRIFHKTGAESMSLSVEVDGVIYNLPPNEDCGCSELKLPKPVQEFTMKVHKLDSLQSEFVLYGFQTELHSPGLVYHSIGVNGASVPSYLHSLRFEHELAYIKPDLIVFTIGINDAFSSQFSKESFIENYNALIARIKALSPQTTFLFVSNTDSYKTVRRRQYMNKTGDVVRDAMRQLAREHHAMYWDLYSVMGGLGSIGTWKAYGYAQRDLIHLTKKGYDLAGDLFFSAFLHAYDWYLEHPVSQLSRSQYE